MIFPGLLLIINYFFYFYNTGVTPVIVDNDPLHYANVAAFINHTGIETPYMDYFCPDTVSASPYHYFPIWINAISSWLFNEPCTYAINILVVLPLLQVLVLSAFWLFASRWSLTLKNKIFSLILFFISGFFFFSYWYIPLLEYSNVFGNNIAKYDHYILKFLVLYSYLLFFLHKIFSRKYFDSFFVVFLVFVSSTTNFMSLLLPTFLFLALVLFKSGLLKKEKIITLISLLVITAFIFLFYLLNSGHDSYMQVPSVSSVLMQWNSFAKIRTGFIIFLEKLLEICTLYLPYIVFVAVLFYPVRRIFNDIKISREYYLSIKIFVITIVCSLFLFVILKKEFSSLSFYNNITASILHIILSITIYLVLIHINYLSRALKAFFIIIVLSVVLYQVSMYISFTLSQRYAYLKRYSQEYLAEVGKKIKDFNSQSVLFRSENISKSENEDWIPYAYRAANYLNYFKPEYCLTTYNIRNSKNPYVFVEPIYKYIKEQRSENYFISFDKSFQSFIEKFHVDFLIAEKNAIIDKNLDPLIDTVIEDKSSGERFIILKKNTPPLLMIN